MIQKRYAASMKHRNYPHQRQSEPMSWRVLATIEKRALVIFVAVFSCISHVFSFAALPLKP